MQKPDKDGFSQLWPTTFLQHKIDKAEAANQALLAFISQAESASSDMTVNYQSDNLFSSTDPVIEWLKQCVNTSVANYLKHLGIGYNVEWTLQGWANVNRRGDYHNLHNHPHSYLSGTYYVQVPSPSATPKTGESRSDLNPSAISFFDPRPQANMNAIAGDNQIDPEFRIQPEAGLILLWPSFLHHLVHPNLSDELRVSVSFNVLLKNTSEYLPS